MALLKILRVRSDSDELLSLWAESVRRRISSNLVLSRKQQQRNLDNPSPDEILSVLSEPFFSALVSMYAGQPQLGLDGKQHNLDATTRIGPDQGIWLYNLCCGTRPKRTLEIGLAYGYATVCFLAAISKNNAGYHTAVDPYQTHWHGIGRLQPQRLDMSASFRLIEERSVPALVHFADRGELFDVIFIDGNHRFDDVLVDFTLSAELCPTGGCIILDDMWMPSISRAVAFIRSNRFDFEEMKTPVANIAAFRRIRTDEREWHHYVEFCDSHEILGLFRRVTPAFLRRNVKAITRLVRGKQAKPIQPKDP